MKTKRKNYSSRDGGILVIVMVIVVTLTLMVAALLNLGKFNSFETERQLKLTKARWIAEAGFEKAAAIIRANAQTLDNVPSKLGPTNFENDAAKGRYEVDIERANLSSEVTQFTVTSVGTVNDVLNEVVEATVKTVLTGAPGPDQGFLALGGSSRIKNSSSIHIQGDIYIAGSGTIGKNADITGTVEDASDPYDINYTAAVDVPIIPFEKIVQDPYLQKKNYAADTNNVGVLKGGAVSITFDGTTKYYNGDVTITDINGSGGGTVVASGAITVTDKNNDLPQGAKLVAGSKIKFETQAGTSGNNELFAFGDIEFVSNTEINGIGNSLLAMGGISLSANASPFSGIIYAEGKYTGSNYGVIFAAGNQDNMRGTVIAWMGFDVQSNLTFTYDRTVFANPNPLPFPNWIETAQGTWQESPF